MMKNISVDWAKNKVKQYWQKRWCRWALYIFAVLYAIYCVTTYFVVPGIVKDKAPEFVANKFHRTLEIKNVTFNPLALSLTIEGMRLTEPNSDQTFASADSICVNASTTSLFRLAPIVDSVEVVNPRVTLIRRSSNSYNIDDFVAFALEPKKDDSPTRFAVDDIEIRGGWIAFDDQPKGRKHIIDKLDVTIPFISSIPSYALHFVDLHIAGRFNQEAFEFSGKTRPFNKDKDGAINIKLTKIGIKPYLEYSPVKPNFDLVDGRISTDLLVSFKKPESSQFGLTVSGNVTLHSLILAEIKGKQVVNLPTLSIDLGKSDVLSKQIQIDKIYLKDPSIHLNRDRSGQWSVERIAKVTAPKSSKQPVKEDASSANSSSSQLALKLKNLTIENGHIQLIDGQNQIPADVDIEAFNLVVDGASVDLADKKALVEKVASNGTKIHVIHDRARIGKSIASGRGNKALARSAQKETGLAFALNHLELANWAVTFENKNKRESSLKTNIHDITVALDQVTNTGETMNVSVAARVNETGHIAISGPMTLKPLSSDLSVDIQDLALSFVQPYINDFVNLTLRKGNLSVKGKLALAQKGSKPGGVFTGDVKLTQFETVDQASKQPLVAWRDLSITGIRANLAPLNINVNQVALNQLNARLILNAKGRLNVQDVLRSKAGGQKSLTDENESEAENQTATVATDDAPDVIAQGDDDETQEAKPLAYSLAINKFLLNNSRVRFTDNFIRPRYTAELASLNGSITGLSTNPDKQARVAIRGRVFRAPLVVQGTVNPLSPMLSLDIKAKVKGMSLPQFSTYSGKYIGYGIAKGKLSFDVAYKIENNKLEAENQLILDQLTLGEKVESKDAIGLPIQLALSLLKDKDGVIDLHLPIGGSIDDPQFSIGGIVVKVIVNLITKAVTSPFSLLASIVGDSQELSWLPFEPGSAVITKQAEGRLVSLAKALENRPGLSLEIGGQYDPIVDCQQTVMKKLKQMKRGDLGVKSGTKVTITQEEYPKYLKRLYSKESFKKPRNWIGFAKDIPVPEMEKLLAQHFASSTAADKGQLMQLANQRSQAVRDWLVEKGKISEERLFLLASKAHSSKNKESGNRVEFSLK